MRFRHSEAKFRDRPRGSTGGKTLLALGAAPPTVMPGETSAGFNPRRF